MEFGSSCSIHNRSSTKACAWTGMCLDCGYRVALLIEDKLIIELKSVERIKGTLPQGETSPRASTSPME